MKIDTKRFIQTFFCNDVEIMTSIASHHHFFILVPEGDSFFYTCLKKILECDLGLWPIKPQCEQDNISNSTEITSYASWGCSFNQDEIITCGLIGIGKAHSEEAILLDAKLIDQNVLMLQKSNILNMWASPNNSICNDFNGYIFTKQYNQILNNIGWFVSFSNIIETVLFVTGVDENKIGKLISEYKKRRMPLFWLTVTKTNQFTMAFDCDESEAVMTEYLRILQVI